MIINYQANPGIKYRYALPIDDVPVPVIAPPSIMRPVPAPNLDMRKLDISSSNSSFNSQRDDPKPAYLPGQRRTRLKRRNFHWKVTGYTPCSKTCGGGTKTYIRACYRIISPSHQIPMNEKRCAHLDPPALTPISCNEEPCSAAYWDGFWGQCSVSCGEGVQQFIPQCKRNLNGKLIVVSDVQCAPNKPSPETRACQERECELFRGLSDNELPQTAETGRPAIISRKEWSVGSWSSCSVTCGNGHRTRSVICPSGQCHPENRPAHAEYCNQGSCDSSNYDPSPSQPKIAVSPQFTHRSGISSWLVTEWSHCSVQCGYKIHLVDDRPLDLLPATVRSKVSLSRPFLITT
ncbi:papilin-like [Dendroctonus ponderosae]|nr:papilin-like [Dendroctonus ponderosae]